LVHGPIGEADDEEKNCQFNADQNIGNITLKALDFFASERFREYKGEEVQVSNGRYGPYIRHGAAFVLPKGENPDVDFERAKELIDEKAIADALLHSIKEKSVERYVLVLLSNGWFVYQCNKKYDFDNLSQADTLIEDKLQKTLIKFCTTGKRKEFWLKKLVGDALL
jgi:DNA topoisomerase-1